MGWQAVASSKGHRYRCGFCGAEVASDKRYSNTSVGGTIRAVIHICPNCERPTFIDGSGSQVPGVRPGNEVASVPSDLHALYDEARKCCGVGAHTSAVLACRKMLMNIGVAHGANAGESFAFYVDFLATSGFVPHNGKGWVDHIRKKGNEATHEIKVMQEADAVELITFVEMLLKFIYEFPAKVPTAPAPKP